MDVSHIVAKTHTAEYAIHKYWSRKPHNVLRKLFAAVLGGKANPTFVDPFCGSGVTLAEACKLGSIAFGCDLNPIAVLLSRVTCSPTDPEEVEKVLDTLINEFDAVFRNDYITSSGTNIRYVVHTVRVRCLCGDTWTQAETVKRGRTSLCPSCATRLSFSIQHLASTKVLQVRTGQSLMREEDGGEAKAECLLQEQSASVSKEGVDITDYDLPMLPNGRVLVFPGMTISDLFTARAFSAACWLFKRAEQIENEELRNICLLFLTSAVVQFSRLIPYRNNLTTGGPAWTVPGFWVAPIHLETNPIVHLRARKQKLISGIRRLWENRGVGLAHVRCDDSIDFLSDLDAAGTKADLIFFDPPYGDSVPYLEFSAIWNAMLRERTRYDREIVISNRTEFPSDQTNYSDRLAAMICLCKKVLAEDGKILVTFNNLDYTAWHAILRPMREMGLSCIQVHYQVPAVVSAKAQFSPKNSYQGDFYCVFGVDAEIRKDSIAKGLSPDSVVKKEVIRVLSARNGKANTVIIKRAAMLTILRENLDPEFILSLEEFIKSFTRSEGQLCVLRDDKASPGSEYLLEDVIRTTAEQALSRNPMKWDELFKRILDATELYGVPSEREARDALAELLDFGPPCRLKTNIKQGILFG